PRVDALLAHGGSFRAGRAGGMGCGSILGVTGLTKETPDGILGSHAPHRGPRVEFGEAHGSRNRQVTSMALILLTRRALTRFALIRVALVLVAATASVACARSGDLLPETPTASVRPGPE